MHAESDQERDHALKQLMRSLNMLRRLVDQLLTMARIDPGWSDKNLTEVSLNSVATDALSKAIPKALLKQVNVELQAEDEISVPGNGELMGLMLSNLIENAIRATPAGGLVRIRIGYRAKGPCLIVEDTGPGCIRDPRQLPAALLRRLVHVDPGGWGVRVLPALYGIVVDPRARRQAEREDRSWLINAPA